MELITLAILVVLVSTLTLLLVLHLRHLRNFNVPGPRPYPIIGNVLQHMCPMDQYIGRIQLLFEEYPRIFTLWLGPVPVVFVNHPEYIEIIMTQCLRKPPQYKLAEAIVGEGLVTSNGEKWLRHRRLIAPTFHMKILEDFIEVFARISQKLIKYLETKVGSDGFDALSLMKKAGLDIICETAMGYKSNCLDSEGELELSKSIEMAFFLTMERFKNLFLYPNIIYYNTSAGRHYKRCCKVLCHLTESVIRDKQEKKRLQTPSSAETDKKQKKAFLDMLLDAKENGFALTDTEIREEVNTFMIAGQDTTAISMGLLLHNLGNNPDVQEKVYEEMQSIFEGSDRAPSMKDLNDMKYTDMVIKESMRIYSTVAGMARVADTDVNVGPYTIPSGTLVMVLLYHLGRNAECYPDPLKFDPDRFLPDAVAARHPYSFIPFSAGPRNCIGIKYAMYEIKTVLSYIIRNYKLHSLKKELVLEPAITLRIRGGLPITITRRNKQ